MATGYRVLYVGDSENEQDAVIFREFGHLEYNFLASKVNMFARMTI